MILCKHYRIPQCRYTLNEPLYSKYWPEDSLVKPKLVVRFFNSSRRLPHSKRHSSLFLHWFFSKFLVVMAPCTPSIYVFLGRPLFLLSHGIHSIINFGILSSGILLTWPYHCSLFFCTMSMVSGFPFTPIISFIFSFCILSIFASTCNQNYVLLTLLCCVKNEQIRLLNTSQTVRLYIQETFISVINQLAAQNFCFTISLFHASKCFEHMCSSSGGQNFITQPLVSSQL